MTDIVRASVSSAPPRAGISVAQLLRRSRHGIGLMPSTYCDSQIENGTLVPSCRSGARRGVVHAVYPTRSFLPEKMRVFLQALRDWRSPFWVSA